MPFPGATTSGFSFSSLNTEDTLPGEFPNKSNAQTLFGDRQTHSHDGWEDIPEQEREQDHQTAEPNTAPKQRRYSPRTCRICLEVVLPTYETPEGGIAAAFNPTPKVSYISSDPEDGRLIRPCMLHPRSH